MNIVYQKDARSGITYAYQNRRIWSEERQKYVNQRKLIGRVKDMETKEIIPTDGRCRKRSPYLTEEEKAAVHKETIHEFGPAITQASVSQMSPVHEEASTEKSTAADDIAHDNKQLIDVLNRMAAAMEEIKTDLTLIKQRMG